jgi:hypothetical protein
LLGFCAISGSPTTELLPLLVIWTSNELLGGAALDVSGALTPTTATTTGNTSANDNPKRVIWLRSGRVCGWPPPSLDRRFG